MIFLLHRRAKKDTHTIGRLYIDNKYICDTLELPLIFEGRENVESKTAIPAGVYECGIVYSNFAKRNLISVENVPDRTYIRFHSGNSVNDTDGCILPGKNKAVGEVRDSREAEKKIFEMADSAIKSGDKILLQII